MDLPVMPRTERSQPKNKPLEYGQGAIQCRPIRLVYWRIVWPTMQGIGRILFVWTTRKTGDKLPLGYLYRVKLSLAYHDLHLKLQHWMW